MFSRNNAASMSSIGTQQRPRLFNNLLPLDTQDRHDQEHISYDAQIRSRTRTRSHLAYVGVGPDNGDQGADKPLLKRNPIWRRSGGDRLLGDGASLAIALLLTFVTTALADAFRSEEASSPSTADKTVLGLGASVTTVLAGRSIAYMWSQLAPRDARLRHTLLDVASAYLLTVAAFGTIFGFVGALTGADRVVLMPDVVPGATLRALDGMYVMTFVAAGVGFPHVYTGARQATPSVWLHLVGWACSLMTTTFVGKVLIATALSVRLVHEDEQHTMDIELAEGRA